MSESDAEAIDTTDAEDAEILLADPDDYHQAQRLREIHDARRRVHRVLEEIDRYTTEDEHETQKSNLADAVTAYVAELEPLLHQADYDYDLPDDFHWDSVLHFATQMGYKPKDDTRDFKKASYGECMLVFRKCNQFLAKVKPLITEDDTDEWEI